MADKKRRHVIADVRRGINGYLPSWRIADNEVQDAVNVDFYKSTLGNKRGGMSAIATTGMTMTGVVSSLFRHVPSTDETLAELWAVDDSGTPIINRMAGTTAFVAPTLKDNPTGNGWDFTAASINGMLGLAYKSAQNRMHFWDKSTVRRGGLATPAAPTATNTGGGAYAAVLRYYNVRWTVQVTGVTTVRSEPSSFVSFTPSGGGTAARVLQPTVANEGETHWEVYGSTDSINFYRLATVAIGTTNYDDSAATTSYSSNTLSDLTGKYTLQKPYRFIAADQNRVLGLGSYNSTDKQNRMEISAVIGSSDIGDAERVDTSQVNSFIDFDENDSGDIAGLWGPIVGSFFVFKTRQTWQLTPSGSVDQPYRQDAISKSIGALNPLAIARAEDAIGNAALYWMSHRGPYRWSLAGLEYIGRGIEDYVIGPTATINLAATKIISRVVYHSDKRQVWYWWATGNSNDPNQGMIFDIAAGAWSRVPTGDKWSNIRCAVMFANTLGAAMSRDLKPYVGQTGASKAIWKADTGTDDNGTTFQAYIITKDYEPGGPGFYGEIGDASLLAKVSTGVTITVTNTADFGLQTSTGTALLTASAGETRVSVDLSGSGLSGMSFVRHQIGDAAAISNGWSLDRLVIPVTHHQARQG